MKCHAGPASRTDTNGWCVVCRKEANDLRRAWWAIAGSSLAYYALTGAEREHIRHLADELRAAGATVASAAAAEETRLDGFLYIIGHPLLQGLKVGRAFDPPSRLRGYQTGCPQRAYELLHVSPYFEDCVSRERVVHKELDAVRLQGEWFDVPFAIARHVIDSQSPFRSIN